ncbi:anion transporter [Pelomicrobium sp.]|uniref:anion transporter n=1 Tax=Pelomicrobium sp. TaxID=2815319 RepID=UPI002FDCD2A3
MSTAILAVFVFVYLGMILGGLPFLQLDRTGIALLGAIALIAMEAVSLEEAWAAVHVPTLILLFAFMVISAQLRLGGFYTFVTQRLTALPLSPPALLALLIVVVAALSAVFSNDIVCLAVAPVLIDACRERRLDPVPYLLALACSANIGSAATLIGNPQNMLIGERLELSFPGYLREAALPVVAGLVITWAVIVLATRRRWERAVPGAYSNERRVEAYTTFNRWQAVKGLSVAAFLFAAFLFTPWPRELLALGGAGLLLMSRRLHSRHMLGLVDWQLLVLFVGLFVVNHALEKTGLPAELVAALAREGIDLRSPMPLFFTTFVLSNLVSNVPAVMLLLPLASHPMAGTLLALASTLAGNLLIVGSIANIIVVEAAARHGIVIDWRRHARVGVPVTLLSLACAGATLAWWGRAWA